MSEAHAYLRTTLERLARGDLDVEEALAALKPGLELGFACVDQDRLRRCGTPEVVYCEGKEPLEAAAIARAIADRSGRVLLTRVAPQHAPELLNELPGAVNHPRARCVTLEPRPRERTGLVAVVAAGTADLPVAEEAAVTLDFCGSRVESHVDVGVAGLHRLVDRLPRIRQARAVVAVAGMEGALPSVLAGLLDRPVVAVPTSVGYGAAFGGLAALLAMLNTCAAGVAVVNIDNGFGAGYLASLINRLDDDPPPETG